MNRREMAFFFWKLCDWPVRSAITAACLLRKMSKTSAVDPITSEEMKANADYFEELAIRVQSQALHDNRIIATQSLDLPLYIWRGMSLLELVMESECHSFLELCCKQPLDDLETGDISPYGDPWINLKMFLNILTCGVLIFIFPDMFNFNPPPRSEVLRSATQRRKRPKGFPYDPQGLYFLSLFYVCIFCLNILSVTLCPAPILCICE